MAKAKQLAVPEALSGLLGIDIDTGFFDFSPVTEEDEKVAKLKELPFEKIPDRLDWTLAKRPYLIPGRKFDLENHKYLVDLYRCDAKEIVVMKSSQAGVSEWLVSYAIHTCDQRNGNVLYVFPTEGIVSDFSTARLGPAIEASEYLNNIIIDGSGSGGMYGSNRITLKRIRDRFLYFRGSQVQPDGQAPKLKSIDADVLILDEVDELDQRAPAIARKRLGHAAPHLGNILWVSTPTFPGYGIHAEYQDSDKRQWFVPCPHCGHKQPLTIDHIVLEWDSVGRPVAWNGHNQGKAWAACMNCHKELDRLAQGEWVAENPSNERAGFHLTKLFSPHNRLIDIVKAFDTVDETKRREAFNQDLGIPYTPKGGSLTSEDLDDCRGDYGHGPDARKTCYMGIDVGNVLHVVVRTMPDFLTKKTKQLYAGEADWQSIHNLVKIYRPKTIVIDANPEISKAREFQDHYPRNMVWVAYYPNQPLGTKREEMATWDVIERKVTLDRTRILDSMFAGFYGRESTLPGHARNIRDYYKHMRASIRVLKEIANSGVEVATYIEHGDDHYCVVSGTLIETNQGSVSVEKIQPGMKVLTRQGYKRVIASGKTSDREPVKDYIFSNGHVVRATGNHPIFVKNKGWIPLDSVIYGDIIETCQMSKVLPIKELSFAATQTVAGGRIGCITPRMDYIESGELSVFIKLFGRIISGKFLRGMLFITKTEILLTTLWKILNVSQEENTSQIMPNLFLLEKALKKYKNQWMLLETCLKNGIKLQKEKNIIENCPRIFAQKIKNFLSAATVGNLLSLFGRREIQPIDSVLMPVMLLTEEKAALMMSRESVLGVTKLTQSTDMRKQSSAQENALNDSVHFIRSEPKGIYPVYNLSVEDAEEYYANGILLHNCHAEVYALAASMCKIGQGWVQPPGQ